MAEQWRRSRGTDLDATAHGPQGLSQIAVESLPTGVLVVGWDGTIVIVNRQLESQFGYDRAELIGRSVQMLLPDASASRPLEARRELRGKRRDGSR
jgi:PAS domain S-box-containing protein